MPLAARGAYIDLLCFQWEEGSITNDPAEVALMLGVSAKEIAAIWKHIERAFPLCEDGERRNPRVDRDRETAHAFCVKQKINGAKGGRPEKPKPSENEIETETQNNPVVNSGITQTKPKKSHPEPEPEPDINTPLSPKNPEAPAVTLSPSRVTRVRPKAVLDQAWERFCQSYPPRDGGLNRAEAKKKFLQLAKADFDPEEIIQGAERYQTWARASGKAGSPYIAQMTTWLNQHRWREDYRVASEAQSSLPINPPRTIRQPTEDELREMVA
jgi:hypothetical protein